MEVTLHHVDPEQLAKICAEMSSAREFHQIMVLVESLFHLVVVESGHIKQELIRMSAEVDAIVAAVHHNTDVANSAVEAINQLVAVVQSHMNDPVALQAALDEITASDTALGNAIANTNPAAPTPAPDPNQQPGQP
jgi:hypothetical protein